MNQEHELALVLAQSQHPDLQAIEKLPRVDSFHSIRIHVIPDISDMQAQLPYKHEPKLIRGNQVKPKNLNKAILRHPELPLHTMPATADLGLLGKLQVHLPDTLFEVALIARSLQISNHMI